MKIKINCTGTENISIDKFTELQGNLKELSKENYEKLKASIIKYGFSFPVFCFKLKNIYYIADAHQRVKILKELRKEGYEVPDLPTVFITAKDKKQAKELLLQLNSNYGKITETGLDEFLNEIDFEVDFSILNDTNLDIIFNANKDIESEWVGMPEYSNKDLTPKNSILVHFQSNNDRAKFSKLIKQKITENTKYIWYPYKADEKLITKSYVNES